ncbi:hypothetical protein [Deinococcus piscis]|nr:hypothetical protein [Deinococcus piscis]
MFPPFPLFLRHVRRGLRRLRPVLGNLLALLALIGGAAFQVRNGGGLSPQLYAAVQAQAAVQPAVHHTAAHPAPQHREHQNHAAHDPRAHHPEQHGPKAHDAGAHCPFCVTQAFGEAANPFVLGAVPPDHLPAALPQLLAAACLLPRWADARAPPHCVPNPDCIAPAFFQT